jgi:hypothetical protein
MTGDLAGNRRIPASRPSGNDTGMVSLAGAWSITVSRMGRLREGRLPLPP